MLLDDLRTCLLDFDSLLSQTVIHHEGIRRDPLGPILGLAHLGPFWPGLGPGPVGVGWGGVKYTSRPQQWVPSTPTRPPTTEELPVGTRK